MSQVPRSRSIARLEAVARRAEARMRARRALAVLPTQLTLALIVVGWALASRKLFPAHVPDAWVWAAGGGAGLGVLASTLYAALRGLPPRAGAMALDAHHDLAGRLTNALEFADAAEARRTRFMVAAIDDACARARSVSAAASVPIAFPPELAVSTGVALAVVAMSQFEVRTQRTVPLLPAMTARSALEMEADDLAMFREALRQLQDEPLAPEVQEAVDRFNRLVEQVARGELNREEALREMRALEDEMLVGAEADRKALDDALEKMADALAESPVSRPVADAIQKRDLERAEEEMRKVAAQLRSPTQKPSRAELERLRKALDRAAKNRDRALEQLRERRAEMRKDLLRKKEQLEKKPPERQQERDREKRLLREKKRELERLDREVARRERAGRRLSRLDRELAQAAQDLLRDLGLSADDLERAAEDLDRLREEQRTDAQKEELRKRLQEMRDLIRQQRQGGEGMRKRLQRFMNRAQGQRRGASSGPPGQPQPGGQQPGGQQGQQPGDQQPGGQGQPQPGGQPPGGQGQQPGGQQPGGQGQQQPGGQGSRPGGLQLGGPGGGSIPIPLPGTDGDRQGGDENGAGRGGKG
ncbi:MAG: hypothetical protein AAGN82_29315, partial [Myxococcota bacterium]